MPSLIRLFVASSLVFACGTVPAAFGQESADVAVSTELPRVRTSSARLKSLIDQAAAGSPTFQHLLRSIASTDGIVQVQDGRCQLRVTGCLSWRITTAGPYRMLFVTIDVGRHDVEVMATIGHELRHVLEILDQPALRTYSDIAFFYMGDRTMPKVRRLETSAAVAAGDAVFRELKQLRASRLP